MNSQRIYNELISRAILETRKKNKDVYYESHHILPKCLGGSNKKDNLVLLTAREHFLAHWLLAKANPDNIKLSYAWNCFSLDNNGRRPTSRHYKYARIRHAEMVGKNQEAKDKISKTVSTMVWIISPENECTRIQKELLSQFINLGYRKGRIIPKRRPHSQETKDKISKAHIGKVTSEEAKINIGNAIRGKTYEERYGIEKAKELRALRKKVFAPYTEQRKRKFNDTDPRSSTSL
jgi:hypothetical protein